ncbi:TPA: flagellar protein FlaG [Aeromonas hydrophila]|uniref:flagellar protein FlaG n=1 Tax=Aeromonas hydrophila TaxID=644 RepID=UPI00107EADAA|nr:flagellar protein FlaG [Aeromonas hydrophila]MCV3292186.1 flagellar protein FlaG [Aeromonas hydrophila]QBX72012.1 flagellar protein FlaG [Aeromonas hydrophila]QBX76711.1 flagellar protein FlaG [Aeromonas hydrophila]WDA22836.1 flagellar protein FlaG [Aeromonas hydrophila]WES92898.1 flagellar protein FlaG [Aeromonas hydrophila]
MANEIGIPSSVTPSSLQPSSKSGQSAAQVLSGTAEEQRVTSQGPIVSQGTNPAEKSSKQKPNAAEIEKEVQNLQKFSELQGWTVNFSVEKDSDQVVIKVMDAQSKSVIRQIPSEEFLAISKRIKEWQDGDLAGGSRTGLLFDNEI